MGKTTLLQKLREVNEVSDTSHTTFNQRVTGEASVSPAASSNPRRGRTTEPLSTVGVDLGVWRYRKDLEPDVQRTRKKGSKPMRSVTFYTWDFGGQEEYYVTHQCFLSTRSLYLMVWDVTLGEEGIQSLGPWLHNIQARAPGSPVVIVGTHCDKIRGEEREKRKVELNRVIYEKYLVGRGPQQLRELGLPRILDVMYVGCPPGGGRGEGVAELRKALYSIAFSLTVLRSGHVGGGGKNKLLEQPIPASFLLLEERVRQLVVECGKEAAPPVLREMVFRECTKDIIANPRELNQAVTFLHENGVMLHYATPALNHLYFVDPQWLCDMLAHIITVPEVNNFIQRYQGKEAGILRTSVLAQVFKGDVFPQAYRQEYIELLGKFEVAMMLDRERLLVPSMLNAQPSFTLHSFPTTFPRPPLPHILSTCPDSAKLFDGETSHSPSSPASPTLLPCDPLSTISLLSEELCHTGLLLRRFYFMTYVPSGFWPRLLSRFLTSTSFVSVVLRALGCEPDHIQKEALRVVSGETSGAIGLEWSYWNTGIELWYKGLSLLRVCEILPNYTFVDCKPSPSIYEQTCREPLDPTSDTTNLSFEINGSWVPVDLSPTRGVEVVVSDVVCPVLLRQEALSSPQCERMWLGAALMSQAVDYLDTLLEDWYPGLGAREGNKTIHSIPYVNRIIPCPYCVNKSSVFDKEKGKELEASSEYTLTSSTHSPNPPSSSYFSVSSSLPTSFPSHAKRTLFNASESDSADHVLSEEQWKPEEPDSEQFAHRETLADMHRIQSKERNPEDGYLAMAFPLEGGEDDSGLVLASRFGFMLETCILASRCGEDLVCPAHPQHPLPVHDLAPDVVFADLPSQYILDPECVDKGEYVNHGTFGDIYHGKVYPTASATDDEGLEVAIKIDRLDSRKYTQETATKAYIEVRGEVSILINLKHEHIIEFVGVVLRPLCFILEWAPLGGLSSMLQKYRKVDARVGPLTLQKTAYQVALGLEYLHRQGIVYYDLKSPNVLVFQFPSPQQSLHCTTSSSSSVSLLLHQDEGPVLVKIADLGISRRMTPGGVMGFKGSPGFMAPEILKYVGTEACTEKVDIFSFGMFLYEMVSLYFPFEKQNLMGSQIEKLVVEGERPPLQNRELNNPILFLDVMRWCWHQDFRFRPMASDLIHSLESPSLPRLLDAISLHDNAEITSACLSTLPVEIVSPTAGPEEKAASSAAAQPPHVARGDLQEELWLCTFERGSVRGSTGGSRAVVVNFRGKASFCTESFEVYDCDSEITAMCSVNDTMWLGSLKGYIFIYDAVSKQFLIRRQIAVVPGQGIVSIHHLRSVRQVAVTRRDGYVLLFNECIQELTLPDDSHYDNRVNSTQLPVRAVLKTPETLPILCGVLVPQADTDSKHLLWCGTTHDQVLVYDLYLSRVEYCRRRCCRPLNEASAMDKIVQVVKMEDQIEEGVVCVWALSQPSQVLYRWRTDTEELVQTVSCSTLHPDPVTSMYVLGTCLQLCLQNGGILMVQCPIPSSPSPSPSSPPSSHDCVNLRGHVGSVFTLLTVGARTLPRHWLPTIIGRSNVIDYYKDLLSEEDITDIHSSMVGQQTRLLVSIGRGFHGVADRLVEPLMTPHDREDNFILLWCT